MDRMWFGFNVSFVQSLAEVGNNRTTVAA